MATKWTPEAAAKRLVKGLDARLRDAGDQWLVKAAGKTVASVLIRKDFVRVDLKVKVPKKDIPRGVVAAIPLKEGKASASWPGGGFIVTEESETEARQVIEEAVSRATPDPEPEPAKAEAETETTEEHDEQPEAEEPEADSEIIIEDAALAAAGAAA